MIEKMSQEERDAYYAKQMKSRKMMAKLKKKKWLSLINLMPPTYSHNLFGLFN